MVHCFDEEKPAVNDGWSLAGQFGVWRLELAVVVVERFGLSTDASVVFLPVAAPYLHGCRRQCGALTYADVLSKHYAGRHREEVGDYVVLGPKVREPEGKPDAGRVAPAFALVVATSPLQMLSSTQGTVRHHHANLSAWPGV